MQVIWSRVCQGIASSCKQLDDKYRTRMRVYSSMATDGGMPVAKKVIASRFLSVQRLRKVACVFLSTPRPRRALACHRAVAHVCAHSLVRIPQIATVLKASNRDVTHVSDVGTLGN
jgi:hypothetical protein